MNRILVVISLLFGLGIVLSTFLEITVLFPLILFSIFFLFSIAAFVKKWEKLKYIIVFTFFLSGLLLGRIAWEKVSVDVLKKLDFSQIVAEGIVDGDSFYRSDKSYFTLNIYKISVCNKTYSVEEKVLVKLKNREEIFSGDRLIVRGTLLPPPSSSNPGEFSYRDYLLKKGIHHILSVNDMENIIFLDYRQLGFFKRITTGVRIYSLDIIKKLFSEKEASLLSGIVLGNTSFMPDELKKDFQITGTFHIAAASGSNIAMLLIIIIFLGELMGISYRKSAPFCIAVVIFYTFMIGCQPSITRAAIMSIIVLFGLIIEKEPDLLTSLFGAAFLILFMDPLQIYDVGFQLSFITVISIVHFTPPLQKVLNFIPLKGFRDCIAVSLAAQIGVIPLGIYYFNQLSLVSLFANLSIIVFTSFSLTLGVIMISLYPLVPFIGILISRVLAVLLDGIIFITVILAKIPYASINMSTPSLVSIVIYYGAFLFLTDIIMKYPSWKKYFKEKFGFQKFALAVLGIVLFLIWYPLLFPPSLKVVFLDIGQGDSIFFKLPDGRTFLIDGGRGAVDGEYDAGSMVVVPFLKRQGIRELDGIFLTHPDNDHLGGLLAVLREFKVHNIFDGLDFDESNKIYKEFLFLAEKEGANYYRLGAGDKILCKDGVRIEVLNPSLPLISSKSHLNENSLVLKLSWKRVSFLFTGDVEGAGEERLSENLLKADSDILKVSHHGSKSSSTEEFLQAVTPDISVISVGKNNTYGHPAPEALERLELFSPSIYRTDLDGAVTVITDGKKYEVFTVKE